MLHDPSVPAIGTGGSDTAGKYEVANQVGHLLRKAYQAHVAIFQALNTVPQITPTQFAVLCTLKDCGPCSLTVIGRSIVIDLATVRGTIERLNDRGLVTYSRDETDRRQVIARLTPQGLEVVEKMVPAARRISEATVQRLNSAERVALNYLLTKISSSDIEEEVGGKERPAKGVS